MTGLFLGLGAFAPSAAAAGDGPSPLGLPGSGWIPDVTVGVNLGEDGRPSLTTDWAGELLMAYETREAGNADIVFLRSWDAGLTWGGRSTVASTTTDELYPHITTDPYSGRIFVAFQEDTAATPSILVAFSDDGGLTWATRTAYACAVYCERPRIASEYWNDASNRQYVVFAQQLAAGDWNWLAVGSTDGGDTWTVLRESGLASTDVRSMPEIVVQRGPDAVDRIVVFYRQGFSYPGANLWLEWSANYGASWTQTNWGVNVNSPLTAAAAHDGSSLMVGYSTVSPANNIVWAIDRDVRTPSSFTTWSWWVGRGYWPLLTVDGQGSTDTTIGGFYHLIAHDVGTERVLYMRAPVTMSSHAAWTPVAVISDEGADASDAFRDKGITTHTRDGTWYAVAGWADSRNTVSSGDDVWVTTPGSRWTFDTNPAGIQILVDGTPQATPFTRSFPAGTFHVVDASSPTSTAPGTRYAWSSWSDGGAVSHSVTAGTADTTLTADFGTEFLLSVVSDHGGVQGSGWYADGDSALLRAVSPQDGTPGTRYAFTHWSGDVTGTSPAIILTMDAPKSAVANWKTQHYVTVTSAHGEVTGEGWYDEGATATIALSAVEATTDGKTYAFMGWTDGATGTELAVTLTVSGPVTVTANWREKGLLETSGGALLGLLVLLAAVLLLIGLLMRRRRKPQAAYPPQATPPPYPHMQPPAEPPATPPAEPVAGPPHQPAT